MGSHIVDSVFFKDLFGTAEMRKVFSDENLLQKWLDVEASLARAEAKLGIIPKAAAAEISRKAFARSGLVVKPENMKRNLNVTGGLICSEAVILELARKMGRLSAHELVYELSMKAFEQNVPFKKCLLETPEITEQVSKEKIAYLLDPVNYVGLSALFVEKVVKSVRAAREKDAVDK
jgi:adenylosuccinate lyase